MPVKSASLPILCQYGTIPYRLVTGSSTDTGSKILGLNNFFLHIICYFWVLVFNNVYFDSLLNYGHFAGINFKKWCIIQSKIKSGATEEVCISYAVIIFSSNFFFILCSSCNSARRMPMLSHCFQQIPF